jgi:hypothetical protein
LDLWIQSSNEILDIIVRSGYSNCITTSKISSLIRDSRIFEPTNWTSLGTDGLISSNIVKSELLIMLIFMLML